MGWTTFPCHRAQTITEVHIISYPIGSWGSFIGGKEDGGVTLTTYLHLVSKVKNNRSYTSTKRPRLIVGCNAKHTAKFT
jgi:hypothetical protein